MAVYCGECESEWSVFADIADHDAQGDKVLGHSLRIAETIISLDGWRGHYLGRDLIHEAIDVLDETATSDELDLLAAYDKHYDDNACNYDPRWSLGYSVSEAVSDMSREYEDKLGEAGYVVEWNDGVTVSQIGDIVRQGS